MAYGFIFVSSNSMLENGSQLSLLSDKLKGKDSLSGQLIELLPL